MKKNILLLALSFVFAAGLFGQSLEWARGMGSSGRDKGFSFDLDANGNIYMSGYFSDTVDFDPGPGVYDVVSKGDFDAFILKLDNAGKFIWVKQLGGTQRESARAVELDDAGNIYVGGYFTGSPDFDPGPDTMFVRSEGSEDIFLYKMDPDGNFMWVKSIGGAGRDALINMSLDQSGNIYGTGFFGGRIDFDPDTAVSLQGLNSTSVDIFTFKFDTDGDYKWAKAIIGPTRADQGFGVTVDSKGNVYTTGEFYSGVAGLDFDPGPDVNRVISAGDRDIFLQKLDAEGNFLWAKSIGGEDRDEGYLAAIDSEDNVYLTGSFSGTVNFNPDTNTHIFTAVDERDAFVQKLDSSGNFVWARQLGGGNFVIGHYVSLDKDDNVYVTGYFEDNLVVDSTGNNDILTAGSADIFLQKLDKDGNELWLHTMGGKDYDSGEAVRVDEAGNIYVAGIYADSCDFDFSTNERTQPGYGDLDIFMLKINTNPTGLNPLTSLPIQLYPNPNTGAFRITLPEGNQHAKLRIFDQLGRTVYQASVEQRSIDIDIRHLSAGTYHVSLTASDGKHYSGKVVLK